MILSTILLSDVKCTEAMVNVLVPQISMTINGILMLLKDMMGPTVVTHLGQLSSNGDVCLLP